MSLQAYLSKVLVRDLQTLARELDGYRDESQIWSTPHGLKNSAGTLALHLIGNTRHFIGTVLGNSGYVRDREFEFSGQPVLREQIKATIADAIREIETTLAALPDSKIGEVYPIEVGKCRPVTGQFLVHLATHFAYHLGQIDYHRRLVTGSSEGVGAQAVRELLS